MSRGHLIRAFPSNSTSTSMGMTLRDYMAIHAPHEEVSRRQGECRLAYTAPEARYMYADEMLKARDK